MTRRVEGSIAEVELYRLILFGKINLLLNELNELIAQYNELEWIELV